MMEPLTDVDRVCAQLAVTVPADGIDRLSLDQAVEDATGLVYGYLKRDTSVGLRPSALAAITAVATRIAARIHRNPREVASSSYNDMSLSLADPRILTGDEERALRPYRANIRGPIPQTPPSIDLEELTWTW